MKDGITVTIDKGHLVLRMPLAKDPQLSKTSGKTRVAASTGGFMDARRESQRPTVARFRAWHHSRVRRTRALQSVARVALWR